MELNTVNVEALIMHSVNLVGSACVDTMVAEFSRNHDVDNSFINELRNDLTKYVELNDVEI